MSSLLVHDLREELAAGEVFEDPASALFEICLRLLQSPRSDAERAGEALLVVAHTDRDQQRIEWAIVGQETGRGYGSIGLVAPESDPERFDDFATLYAGVLRCALNGVQGDPVEEARLAELARLAGYNV